MIEDIMDRFIKMARSESGTHLLNVYKGVPLSFPAKIVEVGEGYLRVLTDTYQIVCMYLEKSTLIQSELLPEIVQAEVIELDTKKHLALLANFHYVEKGIGNRAEVRIQPKDPLTSEIQDKEEKLTLKGELADISKEGIGIYLERLVFFSKVVYPDAEVDIMIELPGEYILALEKSRQQTEGGVYDRFSRENVRYSPVYPSGQRHPIPGQTKPLISPNLQIKAKVVNIHFEKAHDRYRVGMRMLPNSQAGSIISRFISQRQSEIIQEIRELYQLLVSPAEKNIP